MGLFSQIDAVEIIRRDKQIASLTAEIDRLRETLAFYADPDNWMSPSRGFALQYDPEPSPVHKVRHAKAAAALQIEETPK